MRDTGNYDLNQNKKLNRQAGAEERIRKLQRRQNRLRRKALTAVLLAAAILIAAIAGSNAAANNEQAIRVALGEKNYQLEGKEGPQYFEADYKDPEELREDSEELTAEIPPSQERGVRQRLWKVGCRSGLQQLCAGERRCGPSDSAGNGEDQGQRQAMGFHQPRRRKFILQESGEEL